MKVVLISPPDVSRIVIHEMALHMSNHGIVCSGGNPEEGHRPGARPPVTAPGILKSRA